MIGLLVLSILVGMVDWFAVAWGRRNLEYVAKPGTMVFLILWLVGSLGLPASALPAFFLAGLVFCLAGDVLLMLPNDRFLLGLIAFFFGHVAYIVSLNLGGPLLSGPSILLGVPVFALAGVVLARLKRALRQSGSSLPFGALVAYAVVLSLTFWSAATTVLRADWYPWSAWLLAFGGLLFYASDSLLAWNRFVKPVPGGRTTTIILYHLAQWLLSYGVWLALGHQA